MADLASTRVFGKLTVMHDTLCKGEVEADSFKGDGSGLTGIAVVPSGVITMWSGSISSIPSGWALCDGNNGTPNLRNRFIVGAGGSYGVGNTGGADNVTLTTAQMPQHNHSASTGSSGSHNHTATTSSAGSHNHTGSAASAGNHRHSITTYRNSGADVAGRVSHYRTQSGAATAYTAYAGTHSHTLSINSNGAHTHTLTTNTTGGHTHTVSVGNAGSGGSHENRPPYYALAYIMKL